MIVKATLKTSNLEIYMESNECGDNEWEMIGYMANQRCVYHEQQHNTRQLIPEEATFDINDMTVTIVKDGCVKIDIGAGRMIPGDDYRVVIENAEDVIKIARLLEEKE
jgi:hypothetical protein